MQRMPQVETHVANLDMLWEHGIGVFGVAEFSLSPGLQLRMGQVKPAFGHVFSIT
jgi:hypothetical protein